MRPCFTVTDVTKTQFCAIVFTRVHLAGASAGQTEVTCFQIPKQREIEMFQLIFFFSSPSLETIEAKKPQPGILWLAS